MGRNLLNKLYLDGREYASAITEYELNDSVDSQPKITIKFIVSKYDFEDDAVRVETIADQHQWRNRNE